MQPIVFFDPDCSLCLRIKKSIEYLDRKKMIHFMPLTSPAVFEHLPPATEIEVLRETIHMLNPTGVLVTGHQVIDELMPLIPGVRRLAWMLESDSMQRMKKSFHRALEKHRKESSCCGQKRAHHRPKASV
jgi:predicted DCC family thiol-disulfide oxidoreductase YuxK